MTLIFSLSSGTRSQKVASSPPSFSRVSLTAQWGLVLSLGCGLILFRSQTAAAVTQGLRLCAGVLAPALFPYFVLSGLAVETGLAAWIGGLLQRPMSRLFHLPGVCAAVFVLGALGGYPTGARAAAALYRQGLCTRQECERMLGLCNNCGPAFWVGIAGGAVLGSTGAGLCLWGVHLLSALLAGKLWAGRQRAAPPLTAAPPAEAPCTFGQALVRAVSSGASGLLGVCGFVLFFSVLLCLLRESGLLHLLAVPWALLGQDAAFSEACVSGLLEISCGVTALSASAAGTGAKAAAISFLLGFGGCSVQFQSIQQLEGLSLSYRPAVFHKLLQAGLAAAASSLVFRLFPGAITAFAPLSQSAGIPTLSLWLPVWVLAALQGIFSLFSIIFPCKSKKSTL